jgi:hypothetical protein
MDRRNSDFSDNLSLHVRQLHPGHTKLGVDKGKDGHGEFAQGRTLRVAPCPCHGGHHSFVSGDATGLEVEPVEVWTGFGSEIFHETRGFLIRSDGEAGSTRERDLPELLRCGGLSGDLALGDHADVIGTAEAGRDFAEFHLPDDLDGDFRENLLVPIGKRAGVRLYCVQLSACAGDGIVERERGQFTQPAVRGVGERGGDGEEKEHGCHGPKGIT